MKNIFNFLMINLSMAHRCFIICLILSLCSSLSISTDVEGLASLQHSFSVLKGWSGDPYTWDWIQCNDDPTPRVTALLLGGNGLSGLLPDFSSMDALQTIDLHNNSLRGPIPDFLGTFPNLKVLNVANNQFNGTIPASLLTKEGLILISAGNSLLLPPPLQAPLLQLVYPVPPTSALPVESRFQKKGGGDNGSGDGGSDLPNTVVGDARKLRRILKIAIPPSALATIGAVICGICGCLRRRRRRDNDAAADRVAPAAVPARFVGEQYTFERVSAPTPAGRVVGERYTFQRDYAPMHARTAPSLTSISST